MAKYSDIKGFTVQTVSSDPAASQAAGGSWATGGSLNSTGHAQSSGSGSYNAALCAGGQGPPSFSPRYIALTEQYDGSSWTEVADLNLARTAVGFPVTIPSHLLLSKLNHSKTHFLQSLNQMVEFLQSL